MPRKLPSYPDVQAYVILACFAVAPVLGTAVSVVFHAAVLIYALAVMRGLLPFNLDTNARSLTVLLVAYVVFAVVDTLAQTGLAHWPTLIPLATLQFFPSAISGWSTLRKETTARMAILGASAACAGALLIGAVQHYGFGVRPFGGAGNSIVFAMMVCLAAGLCLAGAVMRRDRIGSIAWAGFASGTAAVLLAQTRIAWITLALVSVAVLVIHRRLLIARFRRRSLALAAVAVAAVGFVLFQPIEQRLDRFARDWRAWSVQGKYDTSVGLRFALWRIGLELAEKRPLAGYGLGENKRLTRTELRREFGIKRTFGHFHNGFLTLLVETGLVGVMLYAAIFATIAHIAIATLRRSGSPVERFGATMLAILFLTYMATGLTNLLRGHDIVDASFMVFLVTGCYLASGRQMSLNPPGASPLHALLPRPRETAA